MTVELLAPAKINLGLEVVRKRDDGFHEIATVFQTISVFDRLRVDTTTHDSVQIVDRILQFESNLAAKSLEVLRIDGATEAFHRVEIEKRIPVAAGLGGASADAAAVLEVLHPGSMSDKAKLALQLGSDVPFLLRGGAAMARGRGELLEPLPSLHSCWLVLAVPDIELERKTARLYTALGPADFSDGSRVERVAGALRADQLPTSADLANAFTRPLGKIVPEIEALETAFETAGAKFVALSGAGPAHYTIVPELGDALAIGRDLGRLVRRGTRILIARPVPSGLQVRWHKTQEASGAL